MKSSPESNKYMGANNSKIYGNQPEQAKDGRDRREKNF